MRPVFKVLTDGRPPVWWWGRVGGKEASRMLGPTPQAASNAVRAFITMTKT